MNQFKSRTLLKYFIAAVWIANGLFCKILGFVPRHQQIVAEILGQAYSENICLLIGIAEVFMAIWFLLGYKSRINASLQISIVAIMNVLEFSLVPDLLLWGKLNALFAVLFIVTVYYYEFIISKNLNLQT